MSNEFKTIDELVNNKLVKCYQMQINDNKECLPVFLGEYPDVPLPINKSIKLNNHIAYIVSYILTEEEVLNKIYKLVGVTIFTEDTKNSLCSVDLIYNSNEQKYQTIYNDHLLNSTIVLETLNNHFDREQILDIIIQKTFNYPVVMKIFQHNV